MLVAFTEYNRNVIRLEPPLIVTEVEIQRFVEALDAVLARGVVGIVSGYAKGLSVLAELRRRQFHRSSTGCRYCGMCLDGCVYGSIFNPRLLWKKFEAAEKLIHRGFYALEFKENDDHAVVTTVSTDDGSIRQWRAKRVFLASGHFATARMIARSLGRLNETIRITRQPVFLFSLVVLPGNPRGRQILACRNVPRNPEHGN